MSRFEFIRNREESELYWQVAKPLLDKCVVKAVHGEYSTEDLRGMCEGGRALGIIYFNDRDQAELAVVVEIEPYVSGMLIGNVAALGGTNLKKSWPVVWRGITKYFRACGCKKARCMVSPAMERLLTNYMNGWREIYRVLEMEI